MSNASTPKKPKVFISSVERIRKEFSLLSESERESGLTRIKRDLEKLESVTRALSLQHEVEKYLKLNQQLERIHDFQNQFKEIEKTHLANCVLAKKNLDRFRLFEAKYEKRFRISKVNRFEATKACIDYQALSSVVLEKKFSFRSEIKKALTYAGEVERNVAITYDATEINAFRSVFNSLQEFKNYVEKASAFQKELDKAAKLKKEADNKTKLVDEVKRQIFTRMREQNYRASLKLEGLEPDFDAGANTLESIRAKYAG